MARSKRDPKPPGARRRPASPQTMGAVLRQVRRAEDELARGQGKTTEQVFPARPVGKRRVAQAASRLDARAVRNANHDHLLIEVIREAGGVAGVLDEAHVIGNQWSRHRGVALLRALAKWAENRGES